VDKRGHQPFGYPISTYKGHPGLQLVDRGSLSGAGAETGSADGRWHRVAGIVKRLPRAARCPPLWMAYAETITRSSM